MTCKAEATLQREALASIARRRRSIRGFLRTPVPETVLREIFAVAQSAPSNCNTQPWLVTVVSGKRCERLRVILEEAVRHDAFSMDIPYNSGAYSSVYKARQYDAAARLYNAMGIERSDKEKRAQAFRKNYAFYGAPHVAFICMPEFGGVREAADVGMYAQNLMLAMTAYGLGSCPQTSLAMYAQPIKRELDIPSQHQLLFGISFGFEDTSATANNARTTRVPIEENTQFLV